MRVPRPWTSATDVRARAVDVSVPSACPQIHAGRRPRRCEGFSIWCKRTTMSSLSSRGRGWGGGLALLVIAAAAASATVGAALLVPAPAHAAAPRKNEREMNAREAFAAGRYREALD